jgi:signal peptidase I
MSEHSNLYCNFLSTKLLTMTEKKYILRKIYKRGDIVDIKVILCAYVLYDYNYSSVLIRTMH